MKYCLTVLLCLILLLGTVACGRGQKPVSESSTPDTSTTTTTTDADLPDVTQGDAPTTSGAATTTTAAHGDNVVTMDWGDDTTVPGSTSAATSASSTTTATTMTTTTAVPIATKTTTAAGVRLPAIGFSLDGKLQVAQASASGNVVTLVFHNATSKWETDRDASTVTYACFDKAGNELTTGKLSPGRIRAGNDSVALMVTVPDGTEELRLTAFSIEYWSDGFS